VAHLSFNQLRVHRPWEDWLGMGLGALTVFSPWVLGADDLLIALNALVVGVLIYSVSALELRMAEIWEDWLNLALGLWLLSAPWALGYGELASLAASHHVLGTLVAVLAGFELWQDSRRATQTYSAD
jgi:hypothetical protein